MEHKKIFWGIFLFVLVFVSPLPANAQSPSMQNIAPAVALGKTSPSNPNKIYSFPEIWTLINKHQRARASHFSPELVACLMWEESGFRLVENRESGALGFGQILPSTLREINKRYKTNFTRAQLLASPDANVEATVLALELMWNWKKEKTAALLAYAGGNRNYNAVRKWLAAEPHLIRARWHDASLVSFAREKSSAQIVDALKLCSQPGFDTHSLFD